MKNIASHKYFIACLLALAIIIGAYFRFYNLGEQSYWIDESYTINAVTEILETGKPLLDSGWFYFGQILPNYLIAGSAFIFGENPFAFRLLSALAGILTILVVYFFTKRLFSKFTGLIAGILTALSYWQIAWSRQARGYAFLQLFFILALFNFYKLLEKFSISKLALTCLLTITAILCHPLGLLLLPIFVVAWFIKIKLSALEQKTSTLKYFKKLWQTTETSAKTIIIAIVLITLSIGFYLGSGSIQNILNTEQFATSGQYFNFLITIYRWSLIGAFIGVIMMVFHKNKKHLFSANYLSFAVIIPFLGISFASDIFNGRYLFLILPLLLILTAVAISFISEKLKTTNLKIIAGIILAVLFIFFSSNSEFIFRPLTNYRLEPITPQPDFKRAYEVIKKDNFNSEKIIISPYAPMDKIYLGQTNYTLPIALTGRSQELKNLKEFGFDRYTNTPLVLNAEQLYYLTTNNHGYLIVDDMAMARLDAEIVEFISYNLKSFWRKTPGHFSNIWVYKF